MVLTAFTWRGAEPLRDVPGATAATRRAPARLLQLGWHRAGWPPVELLSGAVDVFHATNYVLPPLRRAAGVVTIADLTFLRHPETVTAATLRYRELVPRSIRRAAVVCTISHAVADEISAEYDVPGDRVVVTTLGVADEWLTTDPPDPDWLRDHGLPERYLLFVGTQEPRKNLPVLLDAYRALLADHAVVPPLVLVGPPGWGPALDASGVPEGAVVMPGYLDNDDLRRVVAGAIALVVPSRYEGFGLPPLEALACGTAVVASDLPVLREVLDDHADYVPAGDVDALAAMLAKVVATNGGPAARIARQEHAAQFSWQRCAQETLAAYDVAVAAR